MNVLIHHDRTGLVKKAFEELGHYVVDCDDGVFNKIRHNHWDLLIAFPSCTYLAVVGCKWMDPKYRNRFPNRIAQRRLAIKTFRRLAYSNVNRVCIENPIGIMSSQYRKPDQYVHPYYFGEPHSKKTCLWLKNLPLLTPTKMVTPNLRSIDYVWYLKTLKLSPEKRNIERARMTIEGMHLAMAEQWGGLK